MRNPTFYFADSFVGGGITEGYGVLETAVKEAWEEANVPHQLAVNLRSAGAVSFLHGTEGGGVNPDTEVAEFSIKLSTKFLETSRCTKLSPVRV